MEVEMGKVLCPSPGIGHGPVALSGLRLARIAEDNKTLQGVRCSRYLCSPGAATPLLAERRHDNTGQSANATSLLLAPA